MADNAGNIWGHLSMKQRERVLAIPWEEWIAIDEDGTEWRVARELCRVGNQKTLLDMERIEREADLFISRWDHEWVTEKELREMLK